MEGCGIGEIGIIVQSKFPVPVWYQRVFNKRKWHMGLHQEKK